MKIFSAMVSLATGNIPALIAGLVVDTLQATIRKVDWAVVIERLVSRVVVMGLRKLERMTTNKLLKDTVDNIIEQLNHSSNRLPQVKKQDEIIKKRASRRRRDK